MRTKTVGANFTKLDFYEDVGNPKDLLQVNNKTGNTNRSNKHQSFF